MPIHPVHFDRVSGIFRVRAWGPDQTNPHGIWVTSDELVEELESYRNNWSQLCHLLGIPKESRMGKVREVIGELKRSKA
jgi:hypothetical protein